MTHHNVYAVGFICFNVTQKEMLNRMTVTDSQSLFTFIASPAHASLHLGFIAIHTIKVSYDL